MLQREARFVATLIERDAAASAARIGELERAGRLREALHCAEVAVRAWEHDPPAGLDDVRAIRDRLVAAGVPVMGSVAVQLNPREREFAELVASGLSNKLIADALVVSVRTVESQISRLLRKLGLTRRQDVKTYLLAHGE